MTSLLEEIDRSPNAVSSPWSAGAPDVRPLPLGRHQVWPPVVLAPMAGVTDLAYRRLCREQGAGLCVTEMVTSRGLVEGSARTSGYLAFDPGERVRSVQLYGVDPDVVGAAVRRVVAEDLGDHVDLNMGCPVPKVTRHGGGAALPWKRPLFRAVVRAAVQAADGVLPVTVKMRMGIDEDHLTYLDAGRAAQEEGVAWVALHGRTAAQGYAGTADWSAIARLVDALDVPVLGNGDIWTAADALRMVSDTGCAGVVVGRGCLGRPWLFADLANAFAGTPTPAPPRLGAVTSMLTQHALLEAEHRGEEPGLRQLRKHMAWYFKGFALGSTTRTALALVSSLAELQQLLAGLDPDQAPAASVAGSPRGRTTPLSRLALPAGWLDDRDTGCVDAAAEHDVSGG